MQIDWWTLAIQTINFLIVVWLLSRLLFNPIRRAISEREAADRAASDASEAKAQAAEEARQAFEAKLADLKEGQRREEAQMHARTEAERKKALEAAQAEASVLLKTARSRIETERTDALRALRTEIAGLARDLARRAIADAGALTGAALRDRVTAHLDGLPETERSDLRADVAGGGVLVLASAAPLGDTEKDAWRAALAQRLGGAKPEFTVDPALLGGAELRFPHAVLSFSVADRLARAAESLEGEVDAAKG